jgi:crossover junction endodeoxyribonuclease RuvC
VGCWICNWQRDIFSKTGSFLIGEVSFTGGKKGKSSGSQAENSHKRNMKSSKTFRLLGVDPGTNVLGFAVVEAQGSQLKLIEIGVLTMGHLDEQQLKLKKIFEELQEIIVRYRPTEMAIEAPFYGKNVQSMLKLGRSQGVAIAAAITKGVSITEYAPKKIKQSVTGNGNASKEQVAAMLETILNTRLGEQYFDATDALATAVCHFFQSKSLPGKGKTYSGWEAFVKENPGRAGGQ